MCRKVVHNPVVGCSKGKDGKNICIICLKKRAGKDEDRAEGEGEDLGEEDLCGSSTESSEGSGKGRGKSKGEDGGKDTPSEDAEKPASRDAVGPASGGVEKPAECVAVWRWHVPYPGQNLVEAERRFYHKVCVWFGRTTFTTNPWLVVLVVSSMWFKHTLHHGRGHRKQMAKQWL